MNFLALLMQYLPTVLGVVQTVETISNAMAKKPSGKEKLAAAVGMIAAVAPALGDSMSNQKPDSTHTENVVNGVVAMVNALGGFAAQQDAGNSGA